MEGPRGILSSLCVCAVLLMIQMQGAFGTDRDILVFGGNGLLGASTVEKLLESGDKITIVNRGNWYWDSKTRILPHVKHVACDRTKDVVKCEGLVKLVDETSRFDAVYDFSSYGPNETKEAVTLLKGKVKLYVLISTDSVYDVCTTRTVDKEPAVESDAVRPEEEEKREMLSQHHGYGHRKLQSEEELVKQRDEEGGFPYVILRLPDVIGPRDTTHRFWVYLLWIKLAPHFRDHAVMVPYFLKDYALSFVYVEDVAKIAAGLLTADQEVLDQAYNLAWAETLTLEELLRTIEDEMEPDRHQGFNIDEKGTTNYFYPSVRTGPINVEKAQKVLNWEPTPLRQAIWESIQFYESAIKDKKFTNQRDEIIQIVRAQIFDNITTEYFETLEKLYEIDLRHFMHVKDEL